ncbi:unnamed protein product [Alopecurus aequalis]
MGDGRRRRKNARTKVAPVAKIDTVADDMLELVFLRLPLPVHLVRADGRVMRSLHGAPSSYVLGHYRVGPSMYVSRPPGCNPVFVPSRSYILGRRNLTLDFLPQPERSGFRWELAEIRGGLLLFQEVVDIFYSQPPVRIVLCDPRTRRFRTIPLSSWFHGCDFMGAFLLYGEATGSWISLSNFRVTCVLKRNGVARACAFSSAAGGRWTSGAVARGSTAICGNDYWTAAVLARFVGSTETAAYWTIRNRVLALDKEAAELSVSVLPHQLPGKPHGLDCAYELPWPPVIRACLP